MKRILIWMLLVALLLLSAGCRNQSTGDTHDVEAQGSTPAEPVQTSDSNAAWGEEASADVGQKQSSEPSGEEVVSGSSAGESPVIVRELEQPESSVVLPGIPANPTVGAGAEYILSMIPEHAVYPVSTEEIKLIISNDSSLESGFGYQYSLEYYNGQHWEPLPLMVAVESIYRILPPGETGTQMIRLQQDQYDYVPGRYRVVKPDAKDLTAEFALE